MIGQYDAALIAVADSPVVLVLLCPLGCVFDPAVRDETTFDFAEQPLAHVQPGQLGRATVGCDVVGPLLTNAHSCMGAVNLTPSSVVP